MPIFNGSLVDELLNELSSRLAAAPELIETYDLEDVRFQLSVLVADKLSSERRRDLDLQGAAPTDGGASLCPSCVSGLSSATVWAAASMPMDCS